MIHFHKKCEREVLDFPTEIKEDLAGALTQLDHGIKLSLPISRPMPSIGRGVHELRLRDRSGIYRVMYVFLGDGIVFLLHAFAKKTQSTPKQNIELTKRRLKEVL